MSGALFLATAVPAITVIVLTLLGLAYLAHLHNQTISFKVVAGGRACTGAYLRRAPSA
jgi:hypothetical protein